MQREVNGASQPGEHVALYAANNLSKIRSAVLLDAALKSA